jgi:hypothetical protein
LTKHDKLRGRQRRLFRRLGAQNKMIVIDCCFVIGASTKTAKQPNSQTFAKKHQVRGMKVKEYYSLVRVLPPPILHLQAVFLKKCRILSSSLQSMHHGCSFDAKHQTKS